MRETPVAKSEPGRRLNEDVALWLSLGGTLVSFGALAGGMALDNAPLGISGLIGTIVAPSWGHWYQGRFVTPTVALRTLSGLATLVTLGLAVVCGDHCDGSGLAGIVFVGGGLTYIGATTYEIIDAPRKARKHNQRIEALGIAPVVTQGAAGLSLGGRF